MGKVMNIIETGRKLREANQISLKSPLALLIIVSSNKALLEEITPFLSYIHSELNVIDIAMEEDVEQYIRKEVLPNLPRLGPRFKGSKDFPAVRKAISKLSSREIDDFQTTGEMLIGNHRFTLVLLG